MALTPILEFGESFWPKLVCQNSYETRTLFALPCPYCIRSYEGVFREVLLEFVSYWALRF